MDRPSAPLTVDAVRRIHDTPLLELVFEAQRVHRAHHAANEVQLCSLLSIKTGGCPEDCGYCAQSARYETPVEATPLMTVKAVLERAKAARAAGATRFCMGAAWRGVREGRAFDDVLSMVRGVRALGLEACATLGMVTEEQARRLAEAGLTAYNHNLDTSRAYYDRVVSTRSYDDRLDTLRSVSAAGIAVCSGGIIGMGESVDDRCAMLATLANLTPQPESVPVNALVGVEGTPLGATPPVVPVEVVRMVATARIVLPMARVRLSAGRSALSAEAQLLCFLAGANSIFYGERLLTTGNVDVEEDRRLFEAAGIRATVLESTVPSAATGAAAPFAAAPTATG